MSRVSHREWKKRIHDLVDIYYRKTPLEERQWINVLDIATEYARVPGTTMIDNDKRDSVVAFICRAIDRGEFKDGKGRIQIANLHPSPLAPTRLDPKWLTFDQLLTFANEGYLFIRRKECIECFSRRNIDFPKTWLPSELTGPDAPDTAKETSPAAPLGRQQNKPVANERWKLPDEAPPQRELRRAWFAVHGIWGKGGPPRSMSFPAITERMNQEPTNANPNHYQAGDFSLTTVRRLFKR